MPLARDSQLAMSQPPTWPAWLAQSSRRPAPAPSEASLGRGSQRRAGHHCRSSARRGPCWGLPCDGAGACAHGPPAVQASKPPWGLSAWQGGAYLPSCAACMHRPAMSTRGENKAYACWLTPAHAHLEAHKNKSIQTRPSWPWKAHLVGQHGSLPVVIAPRDIVDAQQQGVVHDMQALQ